MTAVSQKPDLPRQSHQNDRPPPDHHPNLSSVSRARRENHRRIDRRPEEIIGIGSMLARQMANGRMHLEATGCAVRTVVFLTLCEEGSVVYAANGGIGRLFCLFRNESP